MDLRRNYAKWSCLCCSSSVYRYVRVLCITIQIGCVLPVGHVNQLQIKWTACFPPTHWAWGHSLRQVIKILHLWFSPRCLRTFSPHLAFWGMLTGTVSRGSPCCYWPSFWCVIWVIKFLLSFWVHLQCAVLHSVDWVHIQRGWRILASYEVCSWIEWRFGKYVVTPALFFHLWWFKL